MIRGSTRIIVPLITGLLCAVSIGITWFFIDTSRHGLPSRPPTGNHGQGHSPQADCPKQYKQPVEVDGIEYPLTCFGKSGITSFADASAGNIPAPFVYKAWVVEEGPKGLIASLMNIPVLSNFKPLVCFSLTGKRAVECLYIGSDGSVRVASVILDKEAI